MRRQSFDLEVSPPAIDQVVGELIPFAEAVEEAGQTSIASIAPAENYTCRRKQHGNDAQMKDIGWHLVGHSGRCATQILQLLYVLVGELAGEFHVPLADRPVAIVRQHPLDDAGDILAFTCTKHL